MRYLLLLALPILLSSCGLHRKSMCYKYIDTATVTKVDTLVKIKRDTIVMQGDTVSVHDTIKVDCVDGKPKFKPSRRKEKKGGATVETQIDSNGVLIANASCDSLIHIVDSFSIQINKEVTNTLSLVGQVDELNKDKERWRLSFFIISAVFLAFILINKSFK